MSFTAHASCRTRHHAALLAAALALALGACNSDGSRVGDGGDDARADGRVGDSSAGDGGVGDGIVGDRGAVDGVVADSTSGIDGAGKPGAISIYVAGDLSPVSFSDGLSGQTPADYEIAISGYATLRSANDPAPVQCFDHGTNPVVTNMARDTFVGACDTSKVPTGTYTHGRTKVAWSRYTVDGVYHLPGVGPIAGKLTVFRAYSDTTYKGKSYKAGTGLFTVSGATTIEIPVTFPPLPDVPGLVSFRTVNGEMFMTFLFSRPLFIQKGNADAHWARFHWKVKDSFRWADRAAAGYAAGAWDVAINPLETETVLMYGVSSYYVTASTD